MEQLDDKINIYSEEVRDILSHPPKAIFKWGNTILLFFIILLGVISWVIKYPDIVVAQITITTQIPPEKLVARTSGKIEEIFIPNMTVVPKDTPLAVIQNTASYEDVFKLKKIIDNIEINNGSFEFPFMELGALRLGEIESDFALFENDYNSYILNRDLRPYSVEGVAHSYENLELQERLSLLIQQRDISVEELKLRKKELDRYSKLHDKGVISTQEWETKSIEYLQNDKALKTLNSSVSQMRSAIIDQNRNSRTTKINETKDNLNLYKNAIQSFNKLKEAIESWELKYVLRSSISGKVSYLQIWDENQSIVAGENIFTVVSTGKEDYVGKVIAVAQNSGKIKAGQKVNIRLANFPDREFGILKGTVDYVSLSPDVNGNLLIDVSLPGKLVTSYHKNIKFQQEMRGSADIVTEDLRLIERLLYQFRDLFNRDIYTPQIADMKTSQ